MIFRYWSDDDGLLSQWRAYGGDGGYAIEFSRTDIKELIKEEKRFGNYTIFFDDVMYNDDEAKYKEHFSEQLETIKTYIRGKIEPNQTESDRNKVYEALIRCTAFYKDCGFKQETESRIVALPSIPMLKSWFESDYKNEKPREFRKKNGEQVPYIELFDKNKQDKNGKKDISENTPLPIKKIIVGPHNDKEMRAAWLRIKLDSISRDDIEVTVSQIPFVGR